MDKRKAKTYRDKLVARRDSLVGQVQAAEAYSRERDAEATQDPADMAANAYTKELLMSMSTNDRQLLDSIDAALERIANLTVEIDPIGESRRTAPASASSVRSRKTPAFLELMVEQTTQASRSGGKT